MHKCSRASFSREHQTGILFSDSKQTQLKIVFFNSNFGLKIGPRRGVGVCEVKRKGQFCPRNSPAQNYLLYSQGGQNCPHVCSLNGPFGGGKGAGKPKADFAIQKEKKIP